MKVDSLEIYPGVIAPSKKIIQDEENTLGYVLDKGELSFERAAEIFRKQKDIIIYRGSFNPLHHGHETVMKLSAEKIKEKCAKFYCISTENFDKSKSPSSNQLYNTASQIIKRTNDFVMITGTSLFYAMFNNLMHIFPGNHFWFPVGSDTMNRIIKHDQDYDSAIIKRKISLYKNKISILIFMRKGEVLEPGFENYSDIAEIVEYEDDGVSSTSIRNGNQIINNHGKIGVQTNIETSIDNIKL
jgi:nicotinic acid mononucleotide adenylyltransferase